MTSENNTKGNIYQSGWAGIIFVILFVIIAAIAIWIWAQIDNQRNADMLVWTWTEAVFQKKIIGV